VNGAGPTDARPPFKFAAQTRVAFSDTDAQGIVYYGRYMPYFDLARTEYLRHLGLLRTERGEGVGEFVMRASAVEYFAPARFDDLIEIYARVRRIGYTSSTWEFQAIGTDDGRLMVSAQQTSVFVDPSHRRAKAVPDAFSDVIREFEGGDLELKRA
jgi:acyl-CoA thioester hydrolase